MSCPICMSPGSRPTLPLMMLRAFCPIPLDVVTPMTRVGTSETHGSPDPGLPSNEVVQARVSPNTDDASFSLILIARFDRLINENDAYVLKEVSCDGMPSFQEINKKYSYRIQLTIGPGFVVLRISMQQHSESTTFQARKEGDVRDTQCILDLASRLADVHGSMISGNDLT